MNQSASAPDSLAERLGDAVRAVSGVAALYPAALGAPAQPRVRAAGSELNVLVRLHTAAGASTPAVAREVAEVVRSVLHREGTSATIEVQVGSIG